MAFRAPVDLAAVNAHAADTLVSHLGIVITEAGDDWLRGTMPVDARTVQPYGILHGGASVALAETLGSVAGNLCVDTTKEMVVAWRSTPTTCARCVAAGSRARRVRCMWAAARSCGRSASRTTRASWSAYRG